MKGTQSYKHSSGATVRKIGGAWHLEHMGKSHKLPKKGSFGHAERMIGKNMAGAVGSHYSPKYGR